MQRRDDNDPTRDMQSDVREFYRDGQQAKRGERNPYNAKTQIRAYHGWAAGYCDKWGELPK